MTPTTSHLNVELAKQFAWLLRKDLQATFASKDAPGFDEWWLIQGRQQFAGWADSATPAELQTLFESSHHATVAGVPFAVPKLVGLLAKYRHDVALQDEHYLAWAIVRGMVEQKLVSHAPRSLVVELDQPIPATLPSADAPNAPPAATLLMYMVWRVMDAQTQRVCNLYTPDGRQAFLGWFFSVVGQMGLATLLAGRWRAWVQGPAGTAALARVKAQPQQLAWLQPVAPSTAPDPIAKADKPFGVNLYGFAYGELGIGEDLRMAVACCEAANIPYHVVNVDAGNIRQADNLLKGKTHDLYSKELPPYRNNIFCLPAFDTASRIFMQKGASAFEGYHNIGWWPWELSVFPKAWQPHAFKLVDEVWASSTFLEEMYKRSTDKPVHLVPLAVSVDRLKKHPRKYYGLPDKKYLFLYVFDFNSSVARKNPMAAVNAFKQAFPQTDKSVGLVLKTMNTNPTNPEWQAFLKECKADKRIYVLTETMDRPDVLGLIDCCDAYVSLHRAEGFGRTIAEAILLNKKIITTNYSGNVDFSSLGDVHPIDVSLIDLEESSYFWLDGADSANWADVDINCASLMMINIKNDQTKKIKLSNSNHFSIHQIGLMIFKKLN